MTCSVPSLLAAGGRGVRAWRQRLGVGVVLMGMLSLGHAADDGVLGPQLARQRACLGCHQPERKVVGPAYRDVAQRYQGMNPAVLATRIRQGGSGRWGVVPMPEQTALSEADARRLAEWILAGAPPR